MNGFTLPLAFVSLCPALLPAPAGGLGLALPRVGSAVRCGRNAAPSPLPAMGWSRTACALAHSPTTHLDRRKKARSVTNQSLTNH